MSEMTSVRGVNLTVGDVLPELAIPISATHIVAGAIASRDFMPVHHHKEFAQDQGAPDIFMNILTTNGYVARYLTDWAGPEARLRKIAIRLGVPVIPGHVLRFEGHVTGLEEAQGECVVSIELRASNEFGDHATGSAEVGVPID